MTVNRVAFNEYETAILLNFYIQVLHCNMPHHQAIECCSSKLRKLAKNRKFEIDESYRSISGITYQMSCMEDVYQEKSDKPKLFFKIVRLYKERRNEFDDLLKKAEQMVEGNNEIKPRTIKTELEIENPEEIARIRKTLSQPRFEYGFRNDSVEISRFRESYSNVNGIECELDDVCLWHIIKRIGFLFDEKVYLIKDEEKCHIKDRLKKYEDQGINIVYFNELYDLNFEEYDTGKIISPCMLKKIIQKLCPQYSFRNNYLAFRKNNIKETKLVHDDILRVWGDNLLRTFTELSVKLPLIPYDKIKNVLSQSSDFLWNCNETYVRKEHVYIPEDEFKHIVNYIEEKLNTIDRVSFDELPLSNIRELNSQLSETALDNALYTMLEDRYDRNNKVITKKGESQNTYAAVVKYCQSVDKCTYEKLEEIAKEVSGVIRQPAIVEAANDTMIRIDKERFVADDFVEFDVVAIDNTLDQIVKDGFIGLKEVTTFVSFPFCGYNWNLFLLESYCRRFSQKYMYKTRRANSSNSGAIVSKDCQLSYHSLMAHALARATVNLTENDVFDYLTEAGYMERKRYNDINLLIRDAIDLR